jgi:hypothetical protein
MSLLSPITGGTVPVPPTTALRAGAFVFFALSAFILAVHTTMLGLAAREAREVRRPMLVPLLGAAFLGGWLALALVVGDGANFPLQGGAPERIGLSIALMTIPMAIGIALLAWSRTVRAVNATMPPAWLIMVQGYRSLGFIFLFPYLYSGVVSAGFAWPAALGDMATGVAAFFVGAAVMRGRPGAVRWAVIWNLFGLLDLLVAPAAAVLSGTPMIMLYPLAVVVLFAGPPLGILTHIYSLRNLAVHGRTEHRASALASGSRQAA